MIKTRTADNGTAILWFLVACFIFFIAYFRFTHQDIGWYYSYADRVVGKFSLNGSLSSWSYVDANGNNGAGIVFMIVQAIAITIIPDDLLAIKVLTGIISFATYLAFFYLLRNRLNIRYSFLFSLILVIDPLFTFQIMNRPEMICSFITLIIYNIGLKENTRPIHFFWICFLMAMLVDIHPTSIFASVSFVGILFFRNYRKILYFLAGGIAGLIMITGLNYVFNGTMGILGFLQDSKTFMGDHYFPVMNDPIAVILQRPFVKLKYYIVYLLFGALVVYAGIYFRHLWSKWKTNKQWNLVILNAVCYFLLTLLFSDGGNGYELYALMVYLPVFILLYDEILKISKENLRKIFILLLFIIPAVAVYKSFPRVKSWVTYRPYFKQEYNKIADYVKENDRLLIRPTFSFALSKKKVTNQPLFPIMIYMYNNKQTFPEAVLTKNFDIVAIDEMFLNDVDYRSPKGKFTNGRFHQAVEEVKFDPAIIADLAAKKVFMPFLEYNDFYHGHTVFYRVDKGLLKKYCQEAKTL